MTPKLSAAAPLLVESLARVAEKHRIARKLIVSPARSVGRELLRRLSLCGTGWIGFEVTTPRPLAIRLAAPELERARLSVIDAFEARSLLDEAIDVALLAETPRFGDLVDGVGFRESVQGSIEALRLAGIGPEELDRARLFDADKKRFLRRVLRRYEELLTDRRRVDTAAVFRIAVAAMESEGAKLPSSLGTDVVLLQPGLGIRGFSGRLVSALAARGARVLETDPVRGLETPPRTLWSAGKTSSRRSLLFEPGAAPAELEGAPTAFFRAASVRDELREVLRRVVAEGLRWDQVEIVTPDPEAYGSALHAEALELAIPVTFAVGLPVERTRAGRVVRTYLQWIEEGFQADPIRRLLEAGDLVPPRSRGRHAPAALARRFRSLRIGWGRQRFKTQIREALENLNGLRPGRHDSAEAFGRRTERARGELEALRSILYPALRATPTVPDRMGGDGSRVSPAEIARGLRAFLRRVPRGIGPDRLAREEVERVLERVEATLVRRTAFRAAVTVLRRHLDLRVRAGSGDARPDEGAAPWSSEGGHLHLSDLVHGGFSGREAVFLVGLDSDRVPGFVGQDPVLLDADRRILGEELPTSSELHRQRSFDLAALIARLNGAMTLSFTAWDGPQARSLSPSPLLLQALRLERGEPGLTFKDLDEALGRVVSCVPLSGRPSLDLDDVWMAELGRDEVMRTGVERVGAAFRGLGAGLALRSESEAGPGPGRGVVRSRPDLFDPRRNASLVISASRLEELGTCPLRYLHSVVLGIRPPDDPVLDPDRWLDPLRRGALLHGVYEETLRRARDGGIETSGPELEELAAEILEHAIMRMQAEMPVPGEGALRREAAELASDVRSFVRMVRELGAPWVALELTFGLGDDEPMVLRTGTGELRLRGAIDRIDEDLEGLRVIDYKTGVARDFAGSGTYNGGRRLQHALYAHVAERRLSGSVAQAGYHFPTIRGENRAVMFERLELAGVVTLLDLMLEGAASGSFVPTERPEDCKFCDFATVCRARDTGYGKVESPLAEWSAEHLNAGVWPAFAPLKRVRTFED